uniref:Uncharacterized LOC100180805 n=1 Tax=Ciona intestinalis TaxID=7719 RepID=H2XMG9_CIOIN|nr:uncharacterized protein LOC100180805 [Ciona intestinalis]|eukprot:XP_002130740.1 uncharacterized protein LOC100180805 [Ciona intestinalis]
MANKPLVVTGFIFWLIATGMFLAAMLTKFWKSLLQQAFHFNLFENCVSSVCVQAGWDPSSVGLAMFVPRILMLVAAFFILLGVVIGLVGLCSDRNKCCMVAEGVLTIVGGIVALCACAVYTGLNHNSFINFGYSFYFGWVSGVGYIVAGALHAAGSK